MLIVITGPSGSGKTTLIRRLLARHPEIKFSVSHTTRPPRPGEVNGVDYYFVSDEEFSRLLKKGKFIEWAVVHGYRYGTSKEEFRKSRSSDLVLDIDVQGARQIKNLRHPGSDQAVFIFILPPSQATLKKRLLARGDLTESELERRLKKASQEIRHYRLFDYLIVNDDLDQALEEIEAIIRAERQRQTRMERSVREILNTFKKKF